MSEVLERPDTQDATQSATQDTNHDASINVGVLVEQYLKLRDRIKAADDAHKSKLAPAKEYLESLNNEILAQLNAMGGESIRTPSGTAYRTAKKSATIADGGAFRSYVIEGERWDLVDWRANSTAVTDFIADHNVPPPGINYTTRFVVGVRRS